MKFYFLVLFAFTTVLPNRCKKSRTVDSIVWGESTRLSVLDFLGTQTEQSVFTEAQSAVFVDVNYNKKKPDLITIRALFDKKKSWIKNASTRDLPLERILVHEQIHFDITELIARKFRKTIIENKISFKKFNSKMVDSLNLLFYAQLMQQHREYDRETTSLFSNNTESNWSIKIRKALDSLSEFREPLIKLY